MGSFVTFLNSIHSSSPLNDPAHIISLMTTVNVEGGGVGESVGEIEGLVSVGDTEIVGVRVGNVAAVENVFEVEDAVSASNACVSDTEKYISIMTAIVNNPRNLLFMVYAMYPRCYSFL